jgi:hypothetical protein
LIEPPLRFSTHPELELGDYPQAAEYYDLLYAATNDYEAESAVVHAEALIRLGFHVDGVDLEPAFVEVAAKRCPSGSFSVGDMTNLTLSKRYNAIVCLFSAIGYANTPELLQQTLTGMAGHLELVGVVVIDPWFEPGQLTDGWISMVTGAADGVAVCRMSQTHIDGAVSRLEFEYLIGTPSGIERRRERHEMGLFTRTQMESAFRGAGLSVEWRDAALRRRGAYVGQLGRQA